MAQTLKPGDKVSWNTPQGRTEGTVEERIEEPARIKGHVANASPNHPEYIVKSAKSGKEAIHKPESLKKLRD